jgi:prepilin-type N-terminal cleavage/methylation domain-containing protein
VLFGRPVKRSYYTSVRFLTDRRNGFTMVEMLVGTAITAGVVFAGILSFRTFTRTAGGMEARSAGRSELRALLKAFSNDVEARAAMAPAGGGAWTNGCGGLSITVNAKNGPVNRVWDTACAAFNAAPADPPTAPGLNAGCVGQGRVARVSVSGGAARTYPLDAQVISTALCVRLLPDPANPAEVTAEASALVRTGSSYRRVVERAVYPIRGERSASLQIVAP